MRSKGAGAAGRGGRPVSPARPALPVHRPRKRFGQHFLEAAWVDKLVAAINPQPHETFIEIGPGRGALTRPLAARANAVIAFEIDRDLAAALRETAPGNVTVVEGDFLETASRLLADETRRGPAGSLRSAGNLPYNVASPMMFMLADLSRRGVALADATLMLQREVADRLTAPPGSRDYGVLSVLIGHRAEVSRVLTLPAGAFRPAPKVQSAVVRLRFHDPDPPVADEDLFADIVQAVFTRRRKTLANALLAYRGPAPGRGRDGVVTGSGRGGDAVVTGAGRGGDAVVTGSGRDALAAAGIDGRRRPETLTIAEFARLADAYRATAS
jgi:16S rRNA (adenine1518-N6/adenine1519-N6)-dimethyltransferase